MYRFLSRFCLLLSILLLNISITFAESSAQIGGQVRDESGQALRGVALRLSSRDGVQVSTMSGEDGSFSFGNLLAGDYLVRAEATGFRTTVSEEIELGTGESRRLEM